MSFGLAAVIVLTVCALGGVLFGVWSVRSFAPRAGIAGFAPTGALFLLGCLLLGLGAATTGAGPLAVVAGIVLALVGLVGLFACAVQGAARERTDDDAARTR